MKHIAAGLALAMLLAGCTGHAYISPSGRLPPSHEAAYTQSDSSCDMAGARERSDPASPCVVQPHKPGSLP